MKIIALNPQPDLGSNNRLKEKYGQFNHLILELTTKDLPRGLILSINQDIEEINSATGSEKVLFKVINKRQAGLLKRLEREVKLVPKNYYRNLWIGLGMASFGIPMGIIFSTMLGNMAFLGIGIPVGFAVGIGIGSTLDRKALEEGRQLEVEIK